MMQISIILHFSYLSNNWELAQLDTVALQRFDNNTIQVLIG